MRPGESELRRTFDLDQPVAVTRCAVPQWLPAGLDPYDIVRRVLRPLAPGTCLALTYLTNDFAVEAIRQSTDAMKAEGSNLYARSRAEVLRCLDGLELIAPGLEGVQRWRPDPMDLGADALGPTGIPLCAAVGRKP